MVFPYRLLGPTCRFYLQKSRFLALEDGTDRLSRNVGKDLPLRAVSYPTSAQFSGW